MEWVSWIGSLLSSVATVALANAMVAGDPELLVNYPLMHVTLIHNPTAGAGEVSVDDLTGLLREAGYQLRYQSTKDPEFPSALHAPADLVVVAGGDGTVTKVAQQLPTQSLSVAILPLGTANNIATSLGIHGTLAQIIATWSTAIRRSLSLWIATGSWGERLFLEGCGLGVLTQAAAEMHSRNMSSNEPNQKLATARAVLRETVQKSEAVAIYARFDDYVLEGRFLLLEMLNIGIVGSKLPLISKADPADQWLDVAYVDASEREALLHWLDAGACPTDPPVVLRRCHQVQLEWQEAMIRIGDDFLESSHIDGQANIRLASRSLTVLTPGGVETTATRSPGS